MKHKPFSYFAAAATLLALLIGASPTGAHVEGHMPDSVAEMEYRILLEFKPKDSVTRVKLAMVLTNLDKLAEAEKEFDRALSLDSQNLQAHIGLSILRLKQHRIDAALEMIKKAAQLAPDAPSVYLYHGRILEADHRPSEARHMYNQGLDQLAGGSENPDAEHDRQQLEKALGELEEKLNGKPLTN
ncbi:MAG: tetratricopeptide repeat protein [Desulfobulbaceae bacterium]|nr:tetratricopeptide repeat protein [Desulfobulbaceae bacterium]